MATRDLLSILHPFSDSCLSAPEVRWSSSAAAARGRPGLGERGGLHPPAPRTWLRWEGYMSGPIRSNMTPYNTPDPVGSSSRGGLLCGHPGEGPLSGWGLISGGSPPGGHCDISHLLILTAFTDGQAQLEIIPTSILPHLNFHYRLMMTPHGLK